MHRFHVTALWLVAALAGIAAAQDCPVVTPGAIYPKPPLLYPMPSNRYAVQYRVGSDTWKNATVNISYYGGSNSSPLLPLSGYSAETSMSFVSIPARAGSTVQLRVTKLFTTPFQASDRVSIRPSVKRFDVDYEGGGVIQITRSTAGDFNGEQFILWWDRGTEGGGIEGLAFFLNPPYSRPTGNVKVINFSTDLNDIAGYEALDFEGFVAIDLPTAPPGTLPGAQALRVPSNINTIYLGEGAWVQGKLQFPAPTPGQVRKIYGPGMLDVSRFEYDLRVCPNSDQSLYALSSSGSSGILNHFIVDGIVIADHNHAANDIFWNSTVNNMKTISWNGLNAALRIGPNTTVSNVFVRSGDDSLMVWGDHATVTNATVWQNWNGGVINLGWLDNSPGDFDVVDGVYVVKTDWLSPTTPSFFATTLDAQNNGVIVSLMVPGTKFGFTKPAIYRNIFVEDQPQVLFSLKILGPDCNLIGQGGKCPRPITLTDTSFVAMNIQNLFSPASKVSNSIGFQTLPGVGTLTGTMKITFTNVILRVPPFGIPVPLIQQDALTIGKVTTGGTGLNVQYVFNPFLWD